MLHLLNRAVLLDTASVDRQVQIKDLMAMRFMLRQWLISRCRRPLHN